jgi:hypothetical protein
MSSVAHQIACVRWVPTTPFRNFRVGTSACVSAGRFETAAMFASSATMAIGPKCPKARTVYHASMPDTESAFLADAASKA